MRRRSLLLLTVAGLQACSAGRHYKTDAETFLDLAGRAPASVTSYTFVGSSGGRAYLSAWSGMPWLLGGGEDIYSVALDELPADLAGQIRAGQNPWAR